MTWEQRVKLPRPVRAPYVPCPKCGARQWVRETLGHTCLTCGKEALSAPDGMILHYHPYIPDKPPLYWLQIPGEE